MTGVQHTVILQEETGYELNPERSYFALVVPEDGINLVINPECYDMNGYEAIDATLSVSSAVQRRGARSLSVSPSVAGGGVLCRLPSDMLEGRHYTFSVDVRSTSDGILCLHFGTTTGARLGGEVVFAVPAFWIRRSVSIVAPAGARTLVVRSMDGIAFYADGFQLEDKPYATTFISGNIEAPIDLARPGRLHYGWMGAPHRSSSFRTRFAGAGGRPIPLDELGLRVTEFSGFGYAAPEVITSALALRSDRSYRGAFIPERQFAIGGYIQGKGILDVMRARRAIGGMASGGEAEPSPITLQVQFHDGQRPLHELAEVECVYMGGLEGNINNLYQEKVTLTFRALRPFLRLDGNRGTVANLSAVAYNSPVSVLYSDGTVGALPDGGNAWNDDSLPMRMALGTDGLLYMASTDCLWQFTRSSCVELTATKITNGVVKDLVSGPNGKIYYIYEDDDDGGTTGGLKIYDPLTGVVSGTGVVFATNPGVDLEMWRLRYDPTRNRLYVCGNFGGLQVGGTWRSFDGVEPTAIVYYDFVAGAWFGFPELTDVAYDTTPYVVRDCAPSPNGLWVVGLFRSEGGPSTWARFSEVSGEWEMGALELNAAVMYAEGQEPLGEPADIGPLCCLYEPRYGQLYVGGHFSYYLFDDFVTGQERTFRLGQGICVIDCLSGMVNRIGYGVAQRDPFYIPFVSDMALSADGKSIYVVGQFSEVADTTSSALLPPESSISYRLAYGICSIDVDSDKWSPMSLSMPLTSLPHTGSTVRHADSVLASGAVVASNAYAALTAPEYTQWYGGMESSSIVNNLGAVYVSHSDFSGGTVSPVTVVSVTRGARAVARLEVTGPCHLRKIINATSGASMTPDLVVSAGETVIFSFAPGNVWMRSTTREIAYSNLGKDSWPDLQFVSGDNNIVIDVGGAQTGATSASFYWREEFAAVEALIR